MEEELKLQYICEGHILRKIVSTSSDLLFLTLVTSNDNFNESSKNIIKHYINIISNSSISHMDTLRKLFIFLYINSRSFNIYDIVDLIGSDLRDLENFYQKLFLTQNGIGYFYGNIIKVTESNSYLRFYEIKNVNKKLNSFFENLKISLETRIREYGYE